MGAADVPGHGTTYNTRERLNQMAEDCAQVREGVGKNGDWCVDFHQRFDLADAIRGCDLIKDLAPLFVEDPVRTEAFAEDLPILRRIVKVPLAAGEEWGYRWDFNKLVEKHDIDYTARHAAERRRHHGDDEDCGHLRDALRRASCRTSPGRSRRRRWCTSLGTFSGPVLMEYNYQGRTLPHLPVCLDFKDGKLYPERPAGAGRGAGHEATSSWWRRVTQPVTRRAQMYYRPDGSITNW